MSHELQSKPFYFDDCVVGAEHAAANHHLSAKEIVHSQPDVTGHREVKTNRRCRVERVGIVLEHSKYIGHFCRWRGHDMDDNALA